MASQTSGGLTEVGVHKDFLPSPCVLENGLEPTGQEFVQSSSNAIIAPTSNSRILVCLSQLGRDGGPDQFPVRVKRSGVIYTERRTNVIARLIEANTAVFIDGWR